MNRILTGICHADPANRRYEVAVSRGISFLNAKERFRVQISFKHAMTQLSEDRFLAELLTVHHFLSDPSLLWHMEKQVYASTTLWASTSPWLPDIYQRKASTPGVVKVIRFMHALFPGLNTTVETSEQGYEQALTSTSLEIPFWPVMPLFDCELGKVQVTMGGMIRYTETMSNKNCKTPLALMVKSFRKGMISVDKLPESMTERFLPLDMKTAGEVFTHTTWPRYRYVFVPGEDGIKKLVNVVRLRLKPQEE